MKKSMTETQLAAWFNEHVLYELLMLRYSRQHLVSDPEQLRWNAMFSAFNVSARNLYEFLKAKTDNVSVTDYRHLCRTFKRGPIDPIKKTLDMLNAQCFHMGRERTEAVGAKVNLDKIQTMFKWVESNVEKLVSSFNEDFRSRINLERANLNQAPKYVGGPTGPLAASLSATTTTGHATEYYVITPHTKPK